MNQEGEGEGLLPCRVDFTVIEKKSGDKEFMLNLGKELGIIYQYKLEKCWQSCSHYSG